MSRHQLGTLLGISFALYLPLVACGDDNDILRNDAATPPAAQTNTDPQANTDPQTNTDSNQDAQNNDDLSNADQLTSGDTGAACEVSACTTSPFGAACCTGADDVTANRAVATGACGIDMSGAGFPGCTQLAQPGTLDEACPPVEFPPGPPMPGCCTASGHCGAMETFLGLGCGSPPDASTWVACGQ